MRQLCWAFFLACAACSLAEAADDILLNDAIKNPAYSRALANLLAHGKLPSWTKQTLSPSGDYVGSPIVYSTVEGTRYELFHTCKPHDCSSSQLEVMFSPDGAQAWGAFMEGKSIYYLGAPSPAQQSALKAALQQ